MIGYNRYCIAAVTILVPFLTSAEEVSQPGKPSIELLAQLPETDTVIPDSAEESDSGVAFEAGESFWSNELAPPALDDPTCYLGVESLPTFQKRAENSATCSGEMYIVQAKMDEDVFIDLQGATLTKPLLTQSGRNIIVMNGSIDIQTGPGCGIGELEYSPKDSSLGKNIMPRVPASRLLGFGNYGVSWVEGMLFLANGHQTDVIVANSGEGQKQTAQDALERREHIVVNSRAEGWEGTLEYLHGDFIQSQARQAKAITIENVTALSAHEWIIFGADEVWVRNYYADVDPVYGYDDPVSDRGPGLINYVSGVQTNATIEYYENIHFRLPNGGVYGTGNFGEYPNRYDPRAPEGHNKNAIPDMELHWYEGDASDFAGNPPPIASADFAPTAKVGKNYVSPFVYTYCNIETEQ